MTQIISGLMILAIMGRMDITVLVIDETLGEPSFVIHLLEELEHVGLALVASHPEEALEQGLFPDVLVLGASWLDWARKFRRTFPDSSIIGRGPWQGNAEGEFFPWGDELREPSLPITSLIPKST
jgi:hypothetical protein